MIFLCNLCHQEVDTNSSEMLVTRCLHLYCSTCGPTHFGAERKCRCGTTLQSDELVMTSEIRRGKGNKYLAAGLSPDEIMEVSQFAIKFWEKQILAKMHLLECENSRVEKLKKEVADQVKTSDRNIILRDEKIKSLEAEVTRIGKSYAHLELSSAAKIQQMQAVIDTSPNPTIPVTTPSRTFLTLPPFRLNKLTDDISEWA